jgi:hypothetical protein
MTHARSTCLFLALATAVPAGSITYTLQTAANPTADQLDAYTRIRKAMDSAVGYYDTYTSIRKSLTVQYDSSVATADGGSGGTIRFGSGRSYMVVITAMHEIAHTVGVGTTSQWAPLVVNGLFTGDSATAALRRIESNDTDHLHADTQHFWPYGLNYASEVKSTADLVSHCKVVQGIVQDLFHEKTYFEGRLRNVATNSCASLSGTSLVLGSCTDTASFVRIVSMSDTLYRLELGDRVLDIPNQSKAAGIAASTYSWNGGANQEFRISPSPLSSVVAVRLQMVQSGLWLHSSGTSVLQDPTTTGTGFDWTLVSGSVPAAVRLPFRMDPDKSAPRRDPLGRSVDGNRPTGPVERLGTLPER